MSKTSSIMWVMVPTGSGIATGAPGRAAPLAAAPVNGGEQGILLVNNMGLSGENGNPVAMIGLTDRSDNVAPLTGGFVTLYQGSVARLTGYDSVGDNWDRLRTAPDNADGQAALILGLLGAVTRNQGWNGATWDRLRSLSSSVVSASLANGGLVASNPGEWSIEHRPAANTIATITRVAGGPGVRHVCKSITASIGSAGGTGAVVASVILRDGASAVGPAIWGTYLTLAAGEGGMNIAISGLNIYGTAATPMTLEFAVPPGAGNFEAVALTGYDVSD